LRHGGEALAAIGNENAKRHQGFRADGQDKKRRAR
jgi:hypothetical protein